MTVYKGYMKIIKQNKGMILLYLIIFFGITAIFQAAAKKENYSSYQAESVKIALVDADGGPMAEGLKNYLENFHEVTMMEDTPEVLQENLFYRNVEYIIRIPEDFFERCVVNDEKVPVTKVPGSYTSFYVDQQMNSFIHNVRTYYAAGFSEEEAAAAGSEYKPARVTMENLSGTAGKMPDYGFYFRYIPYMFMGSLCYVMGNVLSAFRRGDLQKRMRASAISGRRQNLEGLLASATVGAGLWIVTIVAAMALYRGAFIRSSGFIYYLLNALMMLLVALALSYLIGIVAQDTNMLNGIGNVLSLGMSFLCGVFVPLGYMNPSVRKVAMFLPVYWYEKANDLLTGFGSITGTVRVEVLQCIGIQFVFTAALVCVTMALAKKKQSL